MSGFKVFAVFILVLPTCFVLVTPADNEVLESSSTEGPDTTPLPTDSTDSSTQSNDSVRISKSFSEIPASKQEGPSFKALGNETKAVENWLSHSNSLASKNGGGTSLREEDLFAELQDIKDYKAPVWLQKEFPYYLAGFDENRSPIIVAEMGKMDLRSLVEKGEEAQADLLKYCKQATYNLFLLMMAQSTEENPVTQIIAIIDFDGLQIRQLTSIPSLSFLLKLAGLFVKLIEDHLAAIYMINTNYVTHQGIRLFKPIFGSVASKVEVFGSNKEKWAPVLRNRLGASQIPPWYGGSNKNYKPLAVYGR